MLDRMSHARSLCLICVLFLHGYSAFEGTDTTITTSVTSIVRHMTTADIDECASRPCENGGTCRDGINNYTCSCVAGFNGTNCSTNIDECASRPCENGGTCRDGINNYTCSCVAGFNGTNCSTNIDECASSPCQHGGTCADGKNGYTCNCVAGYTGPNCNIASRIGVHRVSNDAVIPTAPHVECVDKNTSSLTVKISSTDTNITAYNISIVSSQTNWSSPVPSFATVNRTNETVHAIMTDLTAGVMYNIYVWSLNEGAHSNTNGTTTNRTALNPPQSVAVVCTSTTTISVTWISPSGYYERFEVVCTGQNGATTRSYTVYAVGTPVNSRTPHTASCTGVTSGAVYNVTVSTFVNDSSSLPATSEYVGTVTAPQQPDNLTAVPVSSTSILLSWFYDVSNNSRCTEFIISYNQTSLTQRTVPCNDSNEYYEYLLNNLTSDTLYFISVIAAISGASENSSAENTTGWTLPDKVLSMTVDGRTPRSLNLVITPPDNHNNIFKYAVLVEDTLNQMIIHRIELNCGNVLTATVTQVKVNCLLYGVGDSISAPVNCGSPITYNVTDLEPATLYNISVQAVNPAGCGDVVNITERTNETFANCSGMQVSYTTGYDWIEISWSAPTDPGGDIIEYEVSCRDSINVTNNYTQSTTGRSVTFQGLHSFTNYSIIVRAFTYVGPCPNPLTIVVATDIGPPYSPTILHVDAVDPYTLRVNWSLPSDRPTSDVTYYNVTATDVVNTTVVYISTTTGISTKHLTVTGLHPYWNYSVNVIAFTNNGTFEYVVNATNTMMGRTAETIPGRVTNVQVASLSTQSRCYLANVTWKEPTRWDQHGIITGYTIDWIQKDNSLSQSMNVSSSTRTVQLPVDANNKSYDFTVRASTSVGLGESTTVILGSTGNCPPQAIDNNGGVDIFNTSTSDVSNIDATVSFAVTFDPQVFASNPNGNVTSRGIIVAQDNDTLTNLPESFTYNFYELKKWKDVKGLSVMYEYRTTPDSWNPTVRRRREASSPATQVVYVVGGDTCSDKDNSYCNGPVFSGKNYRVRAIICTQSGCYVTKYSSNTFTTKSQESLAWIAGVVIPCILLIVAIVVIVYMWRRNKKLKKRQQYYSSREPTHDPSIQYKSSVPIRISDFAAEVDEKHRNSNLKFAEEYQGIGHLSRIHPTTFAELPQNRVKNRYSNILAYDHSRVKLQCADPEDPGVDYINANYLTDKNGKRDYIATQGPLPGTVDDFWQMIWEQRVQVIVMVTSLVDKSREKCTKYWPDAAGTDAVYGNIQSENERVYGNITVVLQSEKSFSNSFYTIRTFQLTNGHKEKRQVKQFYCDKIPDYGIPEDTDAFLDFIRHVRQRAGQELDPPIVVHCSAGVGRTGTFIALERLLRQIRESNSVDIVQLILDMRNDRRFMVQTEVQFICIHDCLKIAIEKEWHRQAPPPVAESSEPESVYANGPFAREESPYANLGFENLGYQNDNANGVLVNIDGNSNSKEVSRPAKPPVTSKPSKLRNSTISTKGDSSWPNDNEAVPLTTFTAPNRPPVNS